MKINYQKLITRIGIILCSLLVIYAIYLIERYILYFPIYSIIEFILVLFGLNLKIIENYIIIFSIISIIILQIFLFQLIVLSIIFYSGGFFARFSFYENFISFINQQIEFAKNSKIFLYNSYDNQSMNNFINLITPINNFQKAYNTLKMKNNLSFEIKQFPFGEYLNEIIYLYDKYEKEGFNSDETKKNLINNLQFFIKSLKSYKNFNLIDIIIKFNYRNSLQLLDELMYNSFNNRICKKKNISQNFNIYIISPKLIIPKIKILVIFCGPNALNAEIFSFSQNKIKFYLDIKEVSILIWNYKGYGLRPGFPTFNNIEKDVEELREYIKNNFNDYKIIIHGISIGGYPAIKLAKSFGDNKNICLVADRTYGDIDLIVENLIENKKFLKNIYNIIFPKFIYKSDNVQNYIDAPLRNKIILYDEKDTIIKYNNSSLIYNLTLKYYNEIILPKISNYNQYIKLINFNSNIEYEDIRNELKSLKRNSYGITLEKNTLNFITGLNKYINDFQNFLMYFLVFGYPFNSYKEIYYNKIILAKNYIELPDKMKKIIENNNNKFSINLNKFFSDINFLFIKSNLIIPFNDEEIESFNYNNDNNEFTLQEDFQENLMKYFGYVHRIFCGHNGFLQKEDEEYLKTYFQLNEFILEQNIDENNNIYIDNINIKEKNDEKIEIKNS